MSLAPIDLGRVLVLIPARDEEAALPGVLQNLASQGLHRIRVIDNGSRDRTAAVARQAGAEVVCEPEPGYGRACWRGLAQLPDDVEWILFCDADGSDDLSALPAFWAEAAEADFVLGDRRAYPEGRASLTPAQAFGNALATSLIAWFWNHCYRDLGPLRLIRRSALEAIGMTDRGFGWTVEMQIRAVELGLRIRELPVRYFKRRAGRSKISGTVRGSVAAGWIILSTIATLALRRLRRPLTGRDAIGLLALALGTWGLSMWSDPRVPGAVERFMGAAALAGGGFAMMLGSQPGMWTFWIATLGLRMLAWPTLPADDVWRYIWEGTVQNHGWNPYQLAPAAAELTELRGRWWPLINHPEVPALYPPGALMVFRVLAGCGAEAAGFKAVFVGADLAVCHLLGRTFGWGSAARYAWNPLVIHVVAGRGHFDSMFVAALVAAWLAHRRERWVGAAFWLGVSVSLKTVSGPLVMGAILAALMRGGLRSAVGATAAAVVPMACASLTFWPTGPWLSEGARTFAEVARSAECVPRLIEWWGGNIRENDIFAVLAIGAGILSLVFCRDFRRQGEAWFLSLLVLAPMVHAWYFTWLLPFCAERARAAALAGSISAFVYFWLPAFQASGQPWHLPWPLWFCLWGPVGIAWVAEQAAGRVEIKPSAPVLSS